MDAPLCKICNARHWGREPHALGKAKVLAKAVAAVKPPPAKPKGKKR